MNPVNDPNLLILGAELSAVSLIIGALLNHFLEGKRKTRELLFNARKEAYVHFMSDYGMLFFPTEYKMEDFVKPDKETAELFRNYERRKKLDRAVSQCRLVAGRTLENKLRELHSLITEHDETKDTLKKEILEKQRFFVGLQVEVLMRRDLRAVNWVSFLVRMLMTWFQLNQIKKK